jgi:hypothetical protein
MMIALVLSGLLATTVNGDLSAGDARAHAARSESDGAGEGAALGAALASALTGVAMFATFLVVIQTPDGGDATLDARRQAGPVGAVAGVALMSIASSGLGAGTGYVAAGGDVFDAPAAMGGAMLGATLGSAVGAVPAAVLYAASDNVVAQPSTNIGDAIATGVVGGFFETFGAASSLGGAVFLVPPAASAGAFLAGGAVEALDE